MSASNISSPAVTGVPDRLSVPDVGKVVIITEIKLFAGVSFRSLYPKSAALNAKSVSSRVTSVLSVPSGASLTLVTSKVIVFGV